MMVLSEPIVSKLGLNGPVSLKFRFSANQFSSDSRSSFANSAQILKNVVNSMVVYINVIKHDKNITYTLLIAPHSCSIATCNKTIQKADAEANAVRPLEAIAALSFNFLVRFALGSCYGIVCPFLFFLLSLNELRVTGNSILSVLKTLNCFMFILYWAWLFCSNNSGLTKLNWITIESVDSFDWITSVLNSNLGNSLESDS